MKQFLSILAVAFFALTSKAQDLRIIKDNINCSYGLKDKQGNWIIEPMYTLIQEYNSGYFLVKDPLGDGILTPSGKWLVPCEYDRFDDDLSTWELLYDYGYSTANQRRTSKAFFLLGIKGDEKQLINSQGKVIYTVDAKAELERDNEAHFLIREGNPANTTYIDTSGSILIYKFPGAILPFRERDYTLRSNSTTSYGKIAEGDVRLINQKGELLSDKVFDRAMLILSDRISFEVDGKHGIMAQDGTVLIEPKYRWETGLGNSGESWVILDENGRKGIMKSTGQVLIEPLYDALYKLNGANNQQEGWMVEKEEKKGVIDVYGNRVIPLKYDKIITFYPYHQKHRLIKTNFVVWKGDSIGYIRPEASNAPKKFYTYLEPVSDYNYSYKHSVGFGFIIKENGKYGILDAYGMPFLECEYDESLKRKTTDQRYWFIKGRELVEFAFNINKIEKREWDTFLEMEDKVVYYFKGLYETAQLSSDRTRIVSISKENYVFTKYGNMFVVNRDAKGILNIYNHVTRKKINLRNILYIEEPTQNRFVIRTGSNHAGVVDKNGKIIIDTMYTTMDIQNGGLHIWASQPYSNSGYKWLLLDSNGVQIIKAHFDQSFRINSGDQIVKDGYKTGLMDTKNLKWKIVPTHPCLYKMVDQYYATITEDRKKGVVRADGKYVIEPIYDTVILLAGNATINGNVRKGEAPEFYWLVRRGNRELMIDQDGKISWLNAIRSLKESLLFTDTWVMKSYNQIWNFPVLNYAPSLHFLRGLSPEQVQEKKSALWQNVKIKSVIFDTINSEWEARKVNCNQGNPTYGWVTTQTTDKKMNELMEMCQCAVRNRYGGSGGTVSYKLMSVGSKFATLAKEYPHYSAGWRHHISQAPVASPADEYWNFVDRDGVIKSIELNDIFPNNATLMDEFIEALQQRDELKLECSSVENMLEMVRGRFRLTEDGVSLYLDRSRTNIYEVYSPIELYIPLENLLKHEESKWIVPILKAE